MARLESPGAEQIGLVIQVVVPVYVPVGVVVFPDHATRQRSLALVERAVRHRPVSASLHARARGNALRQSAQRYLAAGQRRQGMRDLLAAVRSWPVDPRYLELAIAALLPTTWRERLLAARRRVRARRDAVIR